MGIGLNLEELRTIMNDNKIHLAIGQITKLMMATDRSVLRVKVAVLPEMREIIARVSWSAVGESAGFFQLPEVNDLCLLGVADGDEETPFVLTYLTNRTDKIPETALDGSMVAKSRAGKKLWLQSDTRANIAKGDAEPTEPLVLGNVVKQVLADFLDKVSTHTHPNGNMGAPTGPPVEAADFVAIKTGQVDNGNILSDFAFTEK